MKHLVPRLRMFAGPNGSGKSTIKEMISSEILGYYINPDEIEKELRLNSTLDLRGYPFSTSQSEVQSFFQNSTLLQRADLLDDANDLRFSDDRISFWSIEVNSYWASVCADFLRQKLLEVRASFTFETVMSSFDKVELLALAQKLGYRTYLYYVATEDPKINLSRVKLRVKRKGHPVPEDKIVSRYYRSLDHLMDAVQHTNRAYIFDNSGHSHTWLCEVTEGSDVELKQSTVPKWFFDSFISKIQNS
jgi:predicted ABC-type ATPase